MSEGGTRLLEEVDFLGGGLAPENGVAVRKAAEARDDLVVAPRVLHVVWIERLEQGERAALRGEILRVLERQVHESALLRRQQPVERALERAPRRGERHRIAREGTGSAAKHVAWKLVEHD